MFGYTLNQNTPPIHPIPNNYCGGFALDAVRFNRFGGAPTPIDMYNLIQAHQAGVGGHSNTLITSLIMSGTSICLPSSIAITARGIFKREIVVFAGNCIPVPDVITEEQDRLITNGFPVFPFTTLQRILTERLEMYYITLVRGSQHWIALKKEIDGSFYAYDPGSGVDEPVTIAGNNIDGTAISHICNELVIAIS